MTDSTYNSRNYRPSDFEKYLQLSIEVQRLEPAEHYPPTQTLSEGLHRPNYSPEQDLFIVESAGEIVGYMDITPEPQIGRVILNCLIHPEHRRQGLASILLDYALPRAEELGVRVAQACTPQDNLAAKSALLKLGFKSVRRFLHMRLDMTRLSDEKINPASQQCRHLQNGEEHKLTEIQNRSFAGNWGYNPNTVEEIIYRLNLSHSSPEDVLLVEDGERVAGYCWTRAIREAETATGESKGQICMLGVDPDYRGQGIGKRVLLAGLSHLKSKGLPVAELTVDSQNKTACALYQSVGFRIHDRIMWYEKVVV